MDCEEWRCGGVNKAKERGRRGQVLQCVAGNGKKINLE